MKRIVLLIIAKCRSIFLESIAFSSRVEFSKVSRRAKIWRKCKVFHSTLDDYSYLGPNSRLVHAHVGKFCSIAAECIIGMGNHTLDYLSTSSIFTSSKNGTGIQITNKNSFDEYKEVFIGNDVWIGQRAMIMGGVHVGNGAVVGAGAIVTKDVPPYAIVAGVPAKIIRFRFTPEEIERLEKIQWWNLNIEVLKDNLSLFQSNRPNFDYMERILEE